MQDLVHQPYNAYVDILEDSGKSKTPSPALDVAGLPGGSSQSGDVEAFWVLGAKCLQLCGESHRKEHGKYTWTQIRYGA